MKGIHQKIFFNFLFPVSLLYCAPEASMRYTRKASYRFSFCAVILVLGSSALLPASGSTGFDNLFIRPYSSSLDTAGTYLAGATMLAPALSVLASRDIQGNWLEDAAAYAGTALVSYGVRTGLKHLVTRDRPYVGTPSAPPATDEDTQSFPSGHSIMAASAAAYTTALYALRYPDSPSRVPVTIAVWTMAAATGALRVASGAHYMTDVLGGLAIGAAIGFAVPYLVHSLGGLQMKTGDVHVASARVGFSVAFSL